MFYLSNFILLPEHKLNACWKQNILEAVIRTVYEIGLDISIYFFIHNVISVAFSVHLKTTCLICRGFP